MDKINFIEQYLTKSNILIDQPKQSVGSIMSNTQSALFIEQINRKDILNNILNNFNVDAIELFNILMTDNNTTNDNTRKGFIFETISIILLVSKCINIDYTNILDGQLQSLKICKNINDLLKINIVQGGNPSDITIKHNNKIIPISIKYRNKFLPNMSSVSEINGEIINMKETDYMIGLIVKDKKLVESHNYKNDGGNQKKLHDKVIENKLLLDENDIKNGLELFCKSWFDYKIDDFIEMINKDYLLFGRERLKLKLHQKITFNKFKKLQKETLHLVSHKPRSGKSITLLNICKYLLETGIDKILIMTSVPATIKSFINDLDKYIDFINIKYKNQDDFKHIKKKFKGIVFCSVQYLKTDVEAKKLYLKNINFNVMIIDECHMGSSTIKTSKDIINFESIINDIRNNIKINIFASGTSDKTRKFYKIKNIYSWDIEDEGYMKQLLSNEIIDNEILDIMINRHGSEFIECYNDNTLNKDYSQSPIQVLMKHSIPENIIKDIKEYNIKNNTNYGYSCSSLFALNKIKNKKTKKYEYENMFELEKSSDGIELLKSFFECIISNNKMNKTTIMKKIEETQSTYKSRISQKNKPKLFLMYLPTHTGNNNIAQLQITLKNFIIEHKLWIDYNIEYSNSIDDSSDYKEEYNTYIETILDKSLKENRKGCILLLGNKGGVGITYHECDVTISLDDGHNLDNQKQRFSRALTEGDNKTIGINVDMNIQRTYLYLNDVIHKHRINTRTMKTNGEILKYLYEHNIFLFNPSDINNGKVKVFEITEYYNKEAENILQNIDDTNLLNEIIVADDDIILDKDEVALELTWNDLTKQMESRIINSNLEGEQKDCPKGDVTKIIIEDDVPKKEDVIIEKVKEDENEKQKRILKEVCKRVLFPILALLSRTFEKLEFTEMLFHDNTKEIVNGILKDKKIILNKNLYNSIIRIMENNNEIINNIREIYRTAPANKIHQLIAKHFIPSIEDIKNNAEIPTPLELVYEMLDKILDIFWTSPKRVFEPCCGKGNFVMKIFEKFYNGLSELYPDINERCEIIITECLYFADLTPMNIFITTEILKCEIQSKTGIEEINYTFNSNTGNTLELNILSKWNINNFHAIIGNPPYQENDIDTCKSKGGTNLYTKFINYSFNNLIENGYLNFITPISWLGPSTNIQSGNDILHNIFFKYDVLYLNLNECKKYFKVGSTFSYYIIQKSINENIITQITSEYKKKVEKIELNFKKYKDLPFLPTHITKETLVLVNNVINNENKIIINRCRTLDTSTKYGKTHLKLIKDDKFKYKTYHTTTKTYYSDIKLDIYDDVKILLNMAGYLKPEICKECNITESKFYIKTNESNAKILINFLNSDNIIKYLELCKYSGFNSRPVLENISYKNLNIINEIKPEENIINEIKPEIIKKGRNKYYLIENKLYKINKNKTQGELFGNYI